MPPVLALCPLPSSHQLVTASSLGWLGSSRPAASSCIQRPALPSFPRLARAPAPPAARAPSPAWGQRSLRPRAGLRCRPGSCWAMPSPCWGGWGGRTEESGSLRRGFALPNNRARPRLTHCGGWDAAGKGWAGSGPALPAGCGPGLSVPLVFRLLTRRGLGRGRACASCSGAGCSAPP